MKELIIYHGSDNVIKKPIYKGGNPHNDFGYGFYCTQELELAKEWSTKEANKVGYVNQYEIDIDNLKILDLTSNKYSVLNWISILVKNRTFNINSQLSLDIRDYLIKNFSINLDKYDIVIGYRADDSYFAYANGFISNYLSLQQLEKCIKLGKLGKQIVVISKKTFKKIKFIKSIEVSKDFYFIKRMIRDSLARMQFKTIKTNITKSIKEIYAIDIVRNKGLKHEN